MLTLVKLVQPENAYFPILVTEFGMVIFANPLHPSKAHLSILVTELGMVMLVNPVQPLNAELSIMVTEFGITKSLTSSPSKYRRCA